MNQRTAFIHHGWKHLIGIAAIISAIGFTTSALQQQAHAEIGPSVNLGTNPLFSAYSNSCPETVASVPADSILIITDVVMMRDHSDQVTFLKTASGSTLAGFRQNRSSQGYLEGRHHKLESGIVVPAGEELILDSCGSYGVTVSGYYAHP
jgi:hypothetical protein